MFTTKLANLIRFEQRIKAISPWLWRKLGYSKSFNEPDDPKQQAQIEMAIIMDIPICVFPDVFPDVFLDVFFTMYFSIRMEPLEATKYGTIRGN
jgi:hypothetical protein